MRQPYTYGAAARRIIGNKTAQTILDFVAHNPGCTRLEIAAGCFISPTGANYHLRNRLRNNLNRTKNHQGRYCYRLKGL